MTKPVNIFAAKTNLSKLIAKAEKGEDVIIARAGKPVARLTQLEPLKKPIRFGLMKGQIRFLMRFWPALRTVRSFRQSAQPRARLTQLKIQ